MKHIYIPVYRMAVGYSVTYGRRWSVLEQLLLVELAKAKKTAECLAADADVPIRLVIEALINLLRSNWIEVQTSGDKTYFIATTTGILQAKKDRLPERLQQNVKWDTLCNERLTGHWMRSEDLEIVYEKDLPREAICLEPRNYTFQPSSASLRVLFRLAGDETLDPGDPQFRPPVLSFARVEVAFGTIQTGLPSDAPVPLVEAILKAANETTAPLARESISSSASTSQIFYDHFGPEDFIFGGEAHFSYLQAALNTAKTAIIIHSCFISPETIESLLGDFERASRRGVKVVLLWGLEPESDGSTPRKIREANQAIQKINANGRKNIWLSASSTGSHAKILMHDSGEVNAWITVLGSCNFLSSNFDWEEVSVVTRNARIAVDILGRLLSLHIPSAGSWDSTARYLHKCWNIARRRALNIKETGDYEIKLVSDLEHYRCITNARDTASREIMVSSDLFGLAAETSVLVPLETAAGMGVHVTVAYSRPSEALIEQGRPPSVTALAKRKILLENWENYHGKLLMWDDNDIVITSFNWLSTALRGTQTGSVELGLAIHGPNISSFIQGRNARSSS